VHPRCNEGAYAGVFKDGDLCCPSADGATFFACCDNTDAPTASPTRSPTDAHCGNGARDADEADVDCGGNTCAARCAVGQQCAAAGDCASGRCGQAGRCEATPHPTRAPTTPPPTTAGDCSVHARCAALGLGAGQQCCPTVGDDV